MPHNSKAPQALLAIHILLILFSTAALVTFLAGPPPAWLTHEPAQTIYIYAWRLSGPLYVAIGAIATITHAATKLTLKQAITLFLAASVIALTAELTGTTTGLPFGPYAYTPLLGYRILGKVPFPIPMSWFYMLYASLAMCGAILKSGETQQIKWRYAAAAGLILTAWDVSMDPAMTRATNHWIWYTKGFFYGMPLLNWFGWWLTGTVIARIMLAIASPSEFAKQVAPTKFPRLLYAANGIMPIALCLRHQLWWAAILGAIAMAIPLSLSSWGIIFPRWRSRSPQRAQPA
jgi:uncharacterized membrane protein